MLITNYELDASDMTNKVSSWRFWVPLIFQSVLILVAPAQAIYTQMTGKTIILQTVPVDPYDILRGYSQTLRYSISRIETLEALSGWNTIVGADNRDREGNLEPGARFYVILQAPEKAALSGQAPRPWKPVAVSRDRPTSLPPNRIAIQGEKSDYLWIDYGLETYYFPENQREEINAQINQTIPDSGQERPFVVEVKVDSQGRALPISLWIGEKNYNF
ncbi:MAG: GDYXXLXY domain-containing protein [Hydrococcus sp. Prado102]|nr:GDYXXLXY domain-containing protein [Hydrococcus sp. Prado102]